ncbi:hypothetical protein [Desulfurivibrio alkaliphilus]|uniref:Uncharacterized protein n=1 Tax=Desulfurivibrio alkaliphilus (strain DSM 19089 / UNIQEM U267 / AHT2) TaxID=589865 RepID=D6Z696_DESAT|nr:hypothetical protein [Desulfurivibrio alkaliphilus]ADH86861.1 conserved hypothetical protein [Desulfurivibrio alkaliphilus AHT 2]
MEIHQTRRFAKLLSNLPRLGKNERVAAARAGRIIADLQINPVHQEAECKRTRHGELRVQDCRKYDLSCGFRLIALKREGRLIFVFIGTHDDCQRWIENNRDELDELESAPIPPLDHESDPAEDEASIKAMNEAMEEVLQEVDEYEERLQAKIDESILRHVFAGLVRK